MAETRSRDRQATESAILEAVGGLLTREGFASLGVNAIAREAGVDKVLIYRYFEGMAGLLRAFAKTEAFWPDVTEILGEGSTDLRNMTTGERWATALVRYARALRRRPITREVLAWELVDRNELTDILLQRREQWFDELMSLLPDEGTEPEPGPTATVIATAIHYLIAQSRLHSEFNGLDIESDSGWSRIEEIVHTMATRTIGSTGTPRPSNADSKG